MDAERAREAEIEAQASQLQPYTEREKELLAKRYTPEQMKAIEAGEAAISPRHLAEQGRLRGDAFRPTYIDDFATLRPTVDKPIRLAADEAKALAEQESSARKGKKAKIPGTSYASEEEDPHMLRLRQQTGLTKQQIDRIRVKNLVSHRVVNQTRMGKIQSLYFLTIAGNQDGMLGIGEGKAAEDEDGRRQAMMNAIRNMRPIPRYEERTIFGDTEGKVGASIVQLSARPPGKKCSVPPFL
jgi:small subunit ribosomal protein S5